MAGLTVTHRLASCSSYLDRILQPDMGRRALGQQQALNFYLRIFSLFKRQRDRVKELQTDSLSTSSIPPNACNSQG